MMKKIRKILTSFMLALLCVFMCLPCSITTAYADGISVDGGYTSVLDDLRKDEQFSENAYPVVENDYTLQVITISESVDKELFVYVYQPHQEHGKYIASSINISATTDNSLNIMNYSLSLVHFDGVFQKYLVTGIMLPTSETRYYDVISIYRVFDETIDEGLSDDNDNTISEVVFKVGKGFILSNTENGVVVQVNDLDVITVIDKFVGFVRYGDGDWWHMWGESACDRHFVAFTTDKPIDRLMEADIYYEYQNNRIVDPTGLGDTKYPMGEIEPGYAYLEYTQKGDYDNGHYKYVWDRIQTPIDFFSTVNIENVYQTPVFNVTNESKMTEEGKANIENKQWVLSFLETSFEITKSLEYHITYYTRVSNVSILRLKFETDGVVYNLGVVDNKQSGSDKPVNTFETTLELNDIFKIILALLALILVLYVLGPVLPLIFSVIGGILKFVFKIITYPFRLLFGRNRRR